ncbi:hypothetical protein COLO4_37074 [Corchorus olitorius]|uniref:Uncharacterized protein n=1 Tax=Corchorus olitorius TaxID=93759 RepID=A0A1R3G3G7_9ROSI|nr:hypothetical protein COLO4_37074 [Corchorus olitorius]
MALICLEQWDKSDEDTIGVIGLAAVGKLPVIPNVLEFIGIVFYGWKVKSAAKPYFMCK